MDVKTLLKNGFCKCTLFLAAIVILAVGRRSLADTLSPAGRGLLPAQWQVSKLWPNLDTVQKDPAPEFAGFGGVYTRKDWQRFSRAYLAAERRLLLELDSQRNAFARQLLSRAAKSRHNGYARLLVLRAFADTFEHTSGSPIAVKALRLYLRRLSSGDIKNPVLVAPVWTMAHELAWLGATPFAIRSQMSVVAEKANVQLAMDLLRAGQYTAAQKVVAMLPILETNRVRRNALLMSQMGTVRALTRQSIAEINFVGAQLPLVYQSPRAAMYVLLHAAYVQRQDSLIRRIMRHWPHSDVYKLGALLLARNPTPMERYQRAQLVIAACHGLGRNILRDRSFYAALNDLVAFRRAKSTRWDRVHRTLAKITIAHLIERFALPDPKVNPLADLIKPSSTGEPSTQVSK
jgi:hypothetical protein